MSQLCEELLEHDLNPYILFNNDGKIINFNKEAEFLMNFVSGKELFELAMDNASQNFGFNKKFIHLEFDKQSFYAIVVGYINDEEIALRLFKEVGVIEPIKIDNSFQESNIYTLIEISKSTTLADSDLYIEEVYDVSIPDFKLHINDFLLILNEIFEYVKGLDKITLKVGIRIGEYEIINKKKYKVVSLEVSSKTVVSINKSLNKGKKNLINIINSSKGIKVELPLIV